MFQSAFIPAFYDLEACTLANEWQMNKDISPSGRGIYRLMSDGRPAYELKPQDDMVGYLAETPFHRYKPYFQNDKMPPCLFKPKNEYVGNNLQQVNMTFSVTVHHRVKVLISDAKGWSYPHKGNMLAACKFDNAAHDGHVPTIDYKDNRVASAAIPKYYLYYQHANHDGTNIRLPTSSMKSMYFPKSFPLFFNLAKPYPYPNTTDETDGERNILNVD